MNIKRMTLAALAAATGAAFAGSSVRGATFVDAGNRLQVLWDDHVVDTGRTTAVRILHHPEYAGCALTCDKPWEGDGCCYFVILPDTDENGEFLRHAPYSGAKVVTKPLVFTGSRMFVNFTTSARGRLFATLRDASGQSIKSIELFGDKVDREVDFPSNCNVAEFAGKPTVVEFDMFDADLYSFRFR